MTRCLSIVCLVSAIMAGLRDADAQQPILDLATVRPQFRNVFEARRLYDQPYGQYRMRSSDSGPSYYASLDVALSRTIMGEDLKTSLTDQERSEWIAHLQSYARPDGTYRDTFGHHQLHANGMTVGGLGALGGKQLYPAGPLYAPFDEPGEVAGYLASSINWTSQWSQSHKFWGGIHVYSQSSQATALWKDAVFDWLDNNVDPNSGWWRIGQQPSNIQGLGGGAHIWPIYEHLGHEFSQPERIIDRILGMQVASGRFGGNSSGYMDLDALYGLKYMRSLAPTYRSGDIDQAVEIFGQWLTGNITGFLAGSPTLHEVLSKVGGFGLLNQLAPDLFPDSTGAQWTDIFTDPELYQTASVETFTNPDLTPVGQDEPSIYSATILADAPVGYWRMGQTAGLGAADTTGNGLSGIYVGLSSGAGAGNLGQPGLRPADGFAGLATDNRAVHLDGAASYVSVSDAPELDITGGVTMEAWIKLDGYPGANGGIVGKYLGEQNQRSYLIYVNIQNGGIGAPGMVISPDGTFTNATDIVDDVALPLDQWVHVVGTYQPSEFMRLYVNGDLVQQLTDNVPSQIFNSSPELWFGRQFASPPDFHLPGLIDEAAIYDRALGGDEILEHYLAATLLAGDYNNDGVVNAADYTVWRDMVGTDVTLTNDTTPGSVSPADFHVWASNFGATADLAKIRATAQVPAPATAHLVCLLCFLYGFNRRTKRVPSTTQIRPRR